MLKTDAPPQASSAVVEIKRKRSTRFHQKLPFLNLKSF